MTPRRKVNAKLQPKWQEFAAVLEALRKAVDEAQKKPDAGKFDGFYKLIASAQARLQADSSPRSSSGPRRSTRPPP